MPVPANISDSTAINASMDQEFIRNFEGDLDRLLEVLGIFGAETIAFPRHESAILEEEGMALLRIDLTNADTPYPSNVVRRKDLITMRLPHHYTPRIMERTQG